MINAVYEIKFQLQRRNAGHQKWCLYSEFVRTQPRTSLHTSHDAWADAVLCMGLGLGFQRIAAIKTKSDTKSHMLKLQNCKVMTSI